MPRSSKASLCSKSAPARTVQYGHTYFHRSNPIQALTDNTRCTITNLIVLALRQLHQQSRDLVLNLHLTKNCGSIVCDSNIAIR